jgi:2-iminobutanoate/2-iminopropanoate deaminase
MQSDSLENVVTPAPVGPYTPAVIADSNRSIAFLSGQLPLDPQSGEISPSDVGGQTRVALTNALQLAKLHGASPSDVLKIVVYTTQLHLVEEINRNYIEVLGDARPARTMVEVSMLPRNALVEVDLTVSVPSRN